MSRPDSGSAGAELEEAAASGSGAVAVELEGDCTAGGGLLGEVGLEARGAAVAKVAVWGGARQEGVEKDGPRAHVRCCWSCCQLQVCVSWLLQVPRCCRNASACKQGASRSVGCPAVHHLRFPALSICCVQKRDALARTYRAACQEGSSA